MRHAKTIILVMVLMALLNFNLFSRISSRVSGIVKEAETNIPLKDVTVYLVKYEADDPVIDNNDKRAMAKTNEKGFFQFDDVYKGNYFVTCEKIGYATLNPLYLAQENNPEDFLPIFFIDEGQIKHFEMTMKKGGSLKVIVQKKDETGTKPIPETICWLTRESKSVDLETGKKFSLIVNRPYTDQNGIAAFKGLERGIEYNVSVRQPGFPPKKKTIVLKENIIEAINIIFDHTNKTGIFGKILKINKLERSILISLALVRDGLYDHITMLEIRDENEFYIPELSEGEYFMYIIYRVKGENEERKKELYIKVKNNEVSSVELSL